MEFLNNSPLLHYVAAGFLLAIGFIYPTIWILGLVGAAYFLYLAQQEQSFKKLCLGGWLTFSTKAAAGVLFFWSTYPIDWLPLDLGKIQLLIIFIYWLNCTLWIGVGGILVSIVINFLKKKIKINQLIYTLLIPPVWVFGEMVGSVFFSIANAGPGSEVGAQFSFGYVGYLLAENNFLIQAAGWGGVYALSFLFITLAAGLLWVVQKLTVGYRYLVLVFLLLILIVPELIKTEASLPTSSDSYSVTIIETNFPVKTLRNKEGSEIISPNLAEAMKAALDLETDYVLLPEDARFFNQSESTGAAKAFFKFQYQNPPAVIIDSGRVDKEDKTFLQAFVYDGFSGEVNTFQKNYLTPQGEYVPYFYAAGFHLFGFGEVIDGIKKEISYQAGSDANQANLPKNIPAVLFCFESVSPTAVKQLIKERPDLPFVVHPVSHAWFHEPESLWHQLDAMLKVQAIWNNKYIVGASSHAVSKTYTPNGEVIVPEIVAEGEYWKVRTIQIPKQP